MGGRESSFFGKGLILFFKGLLMGFSDIIPGVSGATIALILGIYERLIHAIKKFNISFIYHYPRFIITKNKTYMRKAKESWKDIEFDFFIPLGLGIVLALGAGSYFIPYLLDNHPVYTFAFFAGLIMASIHLIIKRKMEGFPLKALVFIIFGAMIAFFIVGLDALRLNHSLLIIFFSGMFAISAMLLPGISGSFVLLLLGQYSFVLESLHNIKTEYLTVLTFIMGVLIGLFGFARVVSWLLKKKPQETIAVLLGLMVGSLRLPFREIFFVNTLHPNLDFTFTIPHIIFIVLMTIIGSSFILIIERKNIE